ncbi:hypothetical protein MLD52_09210 [Puniceicoccaceae bacterium K14]|nr:hypothetical protein [Puniceicoccaceae bacterium K14]
MSASTKPVTETEEPELFGVEADSTVSAQENIPLPWFIGQARLPLRYITDVFYRYTKSSSSGGGKGKSGGARTLNYGSFAAVFGVGPIDKISTILFNNRIVWSGSISRDESNPVYADISTADGNFRIYWGTAAQEKDTVLFDNLEVDEGMEFPPYKNIPYLVCTKVAFGTGLRPENIEVLVWRAPHAAPDSLVKNLSWEGGNAVSGVSEILLSPIFGAGMSEGDIIDLDSWEDASSNTVYAEAYATDSNPSHVALYGHISPKFTRVTTFKRAILDIFSYIDAFLSVREGRFHVGIVRHDGSPHTGLSELTHHEFTSTPRVGAVEKDNVSRIVTSYYDAELKFKKSISVGELSSEYERSDGKRKTLKLELDHFVTSWQSERYSKKAALIQKLRINEITGRVFSDALQGRTIGDFVTINLPASELNVDCFISRVERRIGDVDMLVTLTQDFSSIPKPYVEPHNLRPSINIDTPTPILNYKLMQVVYFATMTRPQVFLLAEKPQSDAIGFNVHYSDDDTTFDEIGNQEVYSLRGSVVNVVADTDTTVRVNASGFDINILQSRSGSSQKADDLILVIENEILSVGDVVALGNDEYDVSVLRGRQNTGAANHSIADEVWIAFRPNLTVIDYTGFPDGDEDGYFKLQPYSFRGPSSLAEATSFVHTFLDTVLESAQNVTIESGSEWLTRHNSSVLSGAYVTWDESIDPVRSGWEVQWAKTADVGLDIWSSVFTQTPGILINPVSDRVDYTFRIRPLAFGEFEYNWVSETHTIIGKTSRPANPTNLKVTPIVGGLNVTFTPAPDLDLNYTWLQIQTSPNFSFFAGYLTAVYGSSHTYHGLSPDNTYYIWATSIDTSGNPASGFIGSVSGKPEAQAVGVIEKFAAIKPKSEFSSIAAGAYEEIEVDMPGAQVGDIVKATSRNALIPHNLRVEEVATVDKVIIYIKNEGTAVFDAFDLEFDGTWTPGDGINTGAPEEPIPDVEGEAQYGWLDLSAGTEESLGYVHTTSEWLDLSAGTEETGDS